MIHALRILLVLAFLVVFAACGGAQPAEDTTPVDDTVSDPMGEPPVEDPIPLPPVEEGVEDPGEEAEEDF